MILKEILRSKGDTITSLH